LRIDVEYIEGTGSISQRAERISFLGFLKHLAMAGQGYIPTVKEYTRVIGMLLHYIEYLSPTTFNNSHFSEPPPERRDPTEKGQFSNLVGKAFGDLLGKRISGAKVTFGYEAAMSVRGHKIGGGRPDLYCIGDGFQFSIEAKGYDAGHISQKDMIKHKDQSRRGPLAVNFTIASVAYNLYNTVRCKYHDPFNDTVHYNEKLNRRILQIYYRGIFEYIESLFPTSSFDEIPEVSCYFIRIIGPDTPYPVFVDEKRVLGLIIDKSFKRYTLPELVDLPDFHDRAIEDSLYFLDTDGIGLALRTVEDESSKWASGRTGRRLARIPLTRVMKLGP
jgi:hypothetical protein